MKQKIVIKLQMDCDRCRSKAMKVAAVENGVMSVAFEGNDKDRLVVIGEGVDAACLTAAVRKKIGCASLESIEEVKPKKEEKKEEKKPTPPPCPPICHQPQLGCCKATPPPCPPICHQPQLGCCKATPPPCSPICHQPQPECCKVVYDSYGPSPSCTIM